MLNHNGQFSNQQVNPPQQTSAPILSHPQSQLNRMLHQQPRLPSVQPSLQPRLTNPATTAMNNNQPPIFNQSVRPRDPQKFNQRTVSFPV